MGLTSSKTFNPVQDLSDLTKKVVIVTGGNSGIGFAAVQQFARKGAKVYLAARNESKATGAIARLEAEGLGPGNGEVIWLKLDLSDPKIVKKAAEDFIAREKRLDILVNNAATVGSTDNRTFGPLDIDDTMITNHFSPFIFTRTLLPLLTQTAREPGADVRIINLSSVVHTHVPQGAHFKSKEDFNVAYDGSYSPRMIRYGATKLANVLWTKELQRRMDADGVPIICIAAHPGSVNTDGVAEFMRKLPFGKLVYWLATSFMLTPIQGASTPLIAAASPVVRTDPSSYKGAYMVPIGKLGTPSKDAQNVEIAAELWNSTESLLHEMDL